MQLNQTALNALLSLSDDALWRTVCSFAEQKGLALPKETPPHDQLEKLRQGLSGTAGFSLEEAQRIIGDFKKRG